MLFFTKNRLFFAIYEDYSLNTKNIRMQKTPEKRQKLKLLKSRIFPKTQKNMRNIKNMTLFCQI